MRDYHRLDFWKKAHSLTLDVFRASRFFPKEERFGLTSQLRRSCLSIGSNISEGSGRSTDAELRRFLDIAGDSASEAEYQLEIARDLGILKRQAADDLISRAREVLRMMAGYLRTLTK